MGAFSAFVAQLISVGQPLPDPDPYRYIPQMLGGRFVFIYFSPQCGHLSTREFCLRPRSMTGRFPSGSLMRIIHSQNHEYSCDREDFLL